MRTTQPRLTIVLLALVASTACACPVLAETKTFNNREDFLIAAGRVGPLTQDGYETYRIDASAGPRVLSLAHFDVWYDLGADISYFGVDNNSNPDVPAGIFSTGGVQFLRANFPTRQGSPTAAMSFVFCSRVNAFGTDMRDVEHQLLFTLSSSMSGIAVEPAESGELRFFGVVSDTPLYFITFSEYASGGGDTVVFDETVFVPTPPGCVALVGDLNDDCAVDAADLAIMLGSWGPCTGDCPADLSVGGEVEATDLALLLGGWTGSCPTP